MNCKYIVVADECSLSFIRFTVHSEHNERELCIFHILQFRCTVVESAASDPNGTSFGCLSHVIHSYGNQMAKAKHQQRHWQQQQQTWKRREMW